MTDTSSLSEEHESLKRKLSMEDMSFIEDFSDENQVLDRQKQESFTDDFVASLGININSNVKNEQYEPMEEPSSYTHQVVQNTNVPTAQVATQSTMSIPAVVGSPTIHTVKENACQPDTSEAEDIVRKLCKNGKLMEFQEGEDFIKVIVYEDSADESDKENHPSSECGQSAVTMIPSSSRPGVLQPIVTNVQVKPTDTGDCQAIKHTPHPRNGYMFYNPGSSRSETPTPLNDSSQCRETPTSRLSSVQERSAPSMNSKIHQSQCTPLTHLTRLNSSGEENVSPPDVIQTPTSEQLQNRVRTLIDFPQYQLVDENGKKIRELHNQKERRRRARIKDACNLLRQLVPGMSDKTDKATVFEFAARYVHYLKSHSGTQYDKEFLMKYSPY